MKAGDTVICINNKINDIDKINFTLNTSYKIVQVNKKLQIIEIKDDSICLRSYNIDKIDKFFIELKEYRKQKLNRINESNC